MHFKCLLHSAPDRSQILHLKGTAAPPRWSTVECDDDLRAHPSIPLPRTSLSLSFASYLWGDSVPLLLLYDLPIQRRKEGSK